MKDSRVSVWTNTTTHATGSTTNTGPTIDLDLGGSLSVSTFQRVNNFGLGLQIIQTNTSGTGQTTVWEWEVSSDNSTWRKGGFIGLATLDSASKVVKFKTALPQHGQGIRYARLLATNAGTGTSTSVCYAEDMGSIPVSNVNIA